MLKIALIGYGYWGPILLRNLLLHPKVKVEYICDLSLKQLKKAKTSYPNISLTQDIKEVLNNKDISCVVIAVPILEHFNISLQCLLAGKNILIEKPMTATVKDAQKLIKLATDKGVILCVDHPYIFSKPLEKIKSLINGNLLGKLYYYHSIRANLGKIDKSTNVFMDLAPHELSILDYLLNKEQPEEFFVTGSSHIFHKPKYTESGTVILRYKSGFVANIYLSWLSPVKIRNITIAGSKKMLLWDDNNLKNQLQIFHSSIEINKVDINLLKYKSGKVLTPKIEPSEPLYKVIDSFVQAVLSKKPALNDGTHGLRIVRILEKINNYLI
ncbi:MAG: GFO/IDH/MocA family oxidoreductase [uncultured bacterium]|uniref:Oxidoreductase domain protein n=1 Tax=Candidatus Daviesbacteria bacterium GW2011_GWC2_40_12 TaxID=1618431 RepID=A0A0G0QRD2_9BACT|nr:MAG: GFO/IDH/MocA family oxidoreductase [uncultured bacterium]KKQ83986.1 MAG: Oxidoreductase domain protein [Candidatus Daviesbacteria bacterium GW2011_GWF2_38_7]KKR17294.1 MAG: Oxidoreductase domain protein [Candidatus Daviesbacteria bacterium GW2011_GWA2_39_33]KKR42693.1 MAG: Oxidoreductase domain protein [Candidatus Daviesbacteria bacterium GW2011_GWC2_40_12]OGE21366.1 MAG: hypothetical protein A2778_04330 [Candidatus Daviesbacteria bacterium RIFCSPHIGHO2_01_FULL_40_24]OGE30116.1 MAG: hy